MRVIVGFFKLQFLFIVCSCGYKAEYVNRIEDKEEAEQVVNQFYERLTVNDYEATFEFFSPSFFKVASKERLKKIYETTQLKLGRLKDVELASFNTRVIEGTHPFGEYTLIYKNEYEKSEATETIRLVREGNGRIRIASYHINSDGFME